MAAIEILALHVALFFGLWAHAMADIDAVRPSYSWFDAQEATSVLFNVLIGEASTLGPQKCSELDYFLHLMPKGADLHLHYSGSIHAETYLAIASEQQDWFAVDPETLSLTLIDEWDDDERADLLTIDEILADALLTQRVVNAWSVEEGSSEHNFFSSFDGFDEFVEASMPAGLHVLRGRAVTENVSYLEMMLLPGPHRYGLISREKQDCALLEAAGKIERLEKELHRITNECFNDATFNSAVDRYVETLERNHARG